MSTDVSLLSDIRAELEDVRAAKTALLKNGQKHAINGSHSFEGIQYQELCKRENQLVIQLATINGFNRSTLPDFS